MKPTRGIKNIKAPKNRKVAKTKRAKCRTCADSLSRKQNKINLEAIGLSHFFSKDEYTGLLDGCSLIDPCETTYELPSEEAARRGYKNYCQAMWIVYAIK